MNAADRLLHPLRRTGPKGSGRFDQISWDPALDEIAERFADIIETVGAKGILPSSYQGQMGVLA
ncbi:MAG: molybdopterin-dependent oxidoreductase [Acidimicrobiia bacterium]|nr:molybdopterin-dependent oxidoreductase [Acidimicrobiia bacterium]